MLRIILIFIFTGFILVSCSEDEIIIDNTTDRDRFFVVTGGGSPSLKVINSIDGSIEINDVFQEMLNTAYNYPVRKIKLFGGSYFVIIPESHVIEILDDKDLSRKAIIDFSESGKMPSDICFPNATTAYVAHENADSLSCIDLTNFRLCSGVKISGRARAVEAAGNQIFTANTLENTVSIIDSRDMQEKHVINVQDKPLFIAVSDSGRKVICLSAGNGKIDTLQNKTAAIATLFNVLTSAIENTREIGIANIKSVDQFPHALAVTGRDLAFVPTDEYLLRLEAKELKNIALTGKTNYKYAAYNFKNQELILIVEENESLWAVTADQTTAKEKKRILLPDNAAAIYPF